MSTFDLDREQHAFGRDLVGPVVCWFLESLDLHLRFLGPEAAHLFVARAGVGIFALYKLYCRARERALPENCRVAWLSRIVLTKGTLLRDPCFAQRVISSEFADKTLGDVLSALLRGEPEWKERVGKLGASQASLPSSALSDFLRSRSRAGTALRDFAKHSENLLNRYLDERSGGATTLSLIDSGWHGTTHSLVARACPEKHLRSLLFARAFRPQLPAEPADIVGLIVEADCYDPKQPASSLLFHRHLIEHLFEPAVPSREVLSPASGDGMDDDSLAAEESYLRDAPPILTGTIESIEQIGRRTVARVYRDHCAAIKRLQRILMEPTAAEARILDVGSRGADFGRQISVPCLLPPVERHPGDHAAVRVTDSLWPQGQLALEYTPAEARMHQKAVNAEASRGSYFDSFIGDQSLSQDSEEREGPVVAIITRTKDRNILLKRAAASVAAQTYREYVWVVVNDGGDPEGVEQVIETCAVERDKITVLNHPKSLGMEAASNAGIKSVNSELIVIHDDDDSWKPEFLERTIGFLCSARGLQYGGVVSHSTYISEEIRDGQVILHAQRPYNSWVQSIALPEMCSGNLFPPIAFVFWRREYDRVNGYDESLPVLGDWQFNLDFLAGSDIGVLPESLANYHHRDVGIAGAYGNSVGAGRDLHREYNTLVRNRALRKHGLLIGQGYILEALRHEIRTSGGGAPNSSTGGGPAASDDLWLAFCAPRNTRWRRLIARAKRYSRIGVRRLLGPSLRTARTPAPCRQAFSGDVELSIVPIPPDFDESAYLHKNPDVLEAVSRGRFAHGYHHYLAAGRWEARTRPTLSDARNGDVLQRRQ